MGRRILGFIFSMIFAFSVGLIGYAFTNSFLSIVTRYTFYDIEKHVPDGEPMEILYDKVETICE